MILKLCYVIKHKFACSGQAIEKNIYFSLSFYLAVSHAAYKNTKLNVHSCLHIKEVKQFGKIKCQLKYSIMKKAKYNYKGILVALKL